MNDRDFTFENDVSMKSKGSDGERDFDEASYQTRSDFTKGATIPKDIGAMDGSFLDGSNEMVKSINVTRKPQAEGA
jgi:hypothetical protein